MACRHFLPHAKTMRLWPGVLGAGCSVLGAQCSELGGADNMPSTMICCCGGGGRASEDTNSWSHGLPLERRRHGPALRRLLATAIMTLPSS